MQIGFCPGRLMYWPVLGLGIRGQIKQLTNTPSLPPVPRSRIQILSCPFQIDQIPPNALNGLVRVVIIKQSKLVLFYFSHFLYGYMLIETKN